MIILLFSAIIMSSISLFRVSQCRTDIVQIQSDLTVLNEKISISLDRISDQLDMIDARFALVEKYASITHEHFYGDVNINRQEFLKGNKSTTKCK